MRPTSLAPSFDDNSTYISHRVIYMKDNGGITCYREPKGSLLRRKMQRVLPTKEDEKFTSYKGREACSSLLVQDQVPRNFDICWPDPGISTSSENQLGWQNMVASDTLEAEQSMDVDVGIGIGVSIMAVVLGTICYLTLSQPHFMDAGDFGQLSILSLWILRITKCASAFFAIASIMVAMPKPPNYRYLKWHCTSEYIEFAMVLLIISLSGMLIGMLIAFIVVSCAAPIFYVALVYCLSWLKNFICNHMIMTLRIR